MDRQAVREVAHNQARISTVTEGVFMHFDQFGSCIVYFRERFCINTLFG